MNTKLRIITAVLSAIFLLSGLSMTIFATDGSGNDVPPVEPPVAPEPVTPSQDPEPVTTPPQPSSEAPVIPTDPATQPPTDAPTWDDTQSGYIDNGTSNEYYTPDSNGSYNSEETAGPVTGNTDLWETNIDQEALKESEWSNIVLDTSNKNKNVQNFSAIKTNNAKNSSLVSVLLNIAPILAVVFLVLSFIGFTYFTVSTINYRKKLKMLTNRELKHRESHQRSSSDYGDTEYPTQADYNRRYQKKRYSSTPYHSKSSKYDTADIPVRKYKSKH